MNRLRARVVALVLALSAWTLGVVDRPGPVTEAEDLSGRDEISAVVIEHREGGRVHDVTAFDSSTWVAHGTVVGRLVEAEAERLVLDPVIPFDDALPRHLAVVGDALAVVAEVPAREGQPVFSRASLWRAGDVARGEPSASLDLDVVALAVEADEDRVLDDRLIVVGEAAFGPGSQIVMLSAAQEGALEVIARQPLERVDSPRQVAIGGDLLHAVVARELDEPPFAETRLIAYDIGTPRALLIHDEALPFDPYWAQLAAAPGRLIVVDETASATEDDGFRLLDTSPVDIAPWPIVHRQRWPYFHGPEALAIDGMRALGVVEWFGLIAFDPREPFAQPESEPPHSACWSFEHGLWLVDRAVHWPCDGLREDIVDAEGTIEHRTTRRHADVVEALVADADRTCIGNPVVGPICRPRSGGKAHFLIDDATSWRFRPEPVTMGHFGLLAGDPGNQLGRVDIFDPDAPSGSALRGSLDGLPSYRDAAAAGSAAYLLFDRDATIGVQALDLRDPASPQRASQASWTRESAASSDGAIAAAAGRVVVAADAAVTVLDATDALAPRVAGSDRLEGSTISLALQGDTAYVGFDATPMPAGRVAYALAAIDVADPDAPREAWRIPLGGRPNAVAIDGDRLLVAERTWLRVFEVDGDGGGEAGALPREVASMALPTWASGLAASDGRVAVALGDGGLWVVRYGEAAGGGVYLPVGFGGG